MALPTTITGIATTPACVGPYISSGGNVYFFGQDGTTATVLQAFKATDPTSSFASIDTETGFSTAVQHLSGYQVGDVIHLCVIDGATTSVNAKYRTFDMSTDAFVTAETIASAFDPQTSAAANVYGGSIVVRSGGEVVVEFAGENVANMGASYTQIYWSRRTGVNTWTAAAQVSAGGQQNFIEPEAVLGVSDAVHFLYQGTGVTQRTLNSSNTLQTVSTATTTAVKPIQAVSYDDAGTTRIVCISVNSTNNPYSVNFDSSNTPTLTQVSIFAANDTIPALLCNDTTDVWGVFKDGNSDLVRRKSTDDGATWDAKAVIFTATVATALANISRDGNIFQRGSSVVIPYVVNDNGTLKYNEYEVRTVAGGGEVFINRGLLFTSKLVRSRLLRRV